ncbi:MAG: nucleoid-associated protein [Ruminococcus sp.]|nr:nucleoid-associated protein [Ruminococcus sp.]
MIIKKAILHILDFSSGMSIFSQQSLDFSDEAIHSYLEKHIEKIHKDSSKKSGTFLEESHFAMYFEQFRIDELDFTEFSNWIANTLNDNYSISEVSEPIDVLIIDYIYEEESYIGILLLSSKSTYTHQVMNDEGIIHNEIIRHYAILPNIGQKAGAYAFVNKDTKEIYFSDKKKSIDGRSVFIIPDILLECTSTVSAKEAVNIVKKAATEVAEEYGANVAVAVSKAKNYIVENSEVSESFCPFDLGDEVFSESPLMREAFEKKIEEKQVPKSVKIEHQTAVKTSKSHKIKTDTGIEITFPVEYFENPEYIEFINNPDGTISIELKNIGKITNK